jgi:hypothetical protein
MPAQYFLNYNPELNYTRPLDESITDILYQCVNGTEIVTNKNDYKIEISKNNISVYLCSDGLDIQVVDTEIEPDLNNNIDIFKPTWFFSKNISDRIGDWEELVLSNFDEIYIFGYYVLQGSYHGLDIEEELVKILSNEMTAEIDKEIIEQLNKMALPPHMMKPLNLIQPIKNNLILPYNKEILITDSYITYMGGIINEFNFN